MPNYSVAVSISARQVYGSVTVAVCVLLLLLVAPSRAANGLTTSRADSTPSAPVYNYDDLPTDHVCTTVLVAGPVDRAARSASVGADLTYDLPSNLIATNAIDDVVRSADELLVPGGTRIGTAGSRASIREVTGGLNDAQALFMDLSRGGTLVTDTTYPGTLVRLPDGGTVGLRTTMTNSPGSVANIDVNIAGIDITKIKFNP